MRGWPCRAAPWRRRTVAPTRCAPEWLADKLKTRRSEMRGKGEQEEAGAPGSRKRATPAGARAQLRRDGRVPLKSARRCVDPMPGFPCGRSSLLLAFVKARRLRPSHAPNAHGSRFRPVVCSRGQTRLALPLGQALGSRTRRLPTHLPRTRCPHRSRRGGRHVRLSGAHGVIMTITSLFHLVQPSRASSVAARNGAVGAAWAIKPIGDCSLGRAACMCERDRARAVACAATSPARGGNTRHAHADASDTLACTCFRMHLSI